MIPEILPIGYYLVRESLIKENTNEHIDKEHCRVSVQKLKRALFIITGFLPAE